MTGELDLRALFAEPWEGEGTVMRPRWQRWLPAPDRFAFRSERRNVSDDGWDVLTPRADGFDFTPYVIRTPVAGPLRLPLRHRDSVVLETDGTMHDTIELSLLGVGVGRVEMRLRRAGKPGVTASVPGRLAST